MKLNLATDNDTWHATRNSCDRKHMMICIKFFGMLITFGMIDGFLHLELLETALMRY